MKKSLTTVAMALAFTFSILAIGACAKSPSDEADGNGTAAEDSVGTGETPGSGENEGSGEQTGDGGSDNGAENGGDTGNEEETAPEPEDNYEYYITCKRDGVNIRSGAGTEHSVIGTAEKGTTYVLRGKVGDWYKTYYKNQTAYINASYFDVFSIEKSENDAVEEVLEKAMRLWASLMSTAPCVCTTDTEISSKVSRPRNSTVRPWYSTSFTKARRWCCRPLPDFNRYREPMCPVPNSVGETASISPIRSDRTIREWNESGM